MKTKNFFGLLIVGSLVICGTDNHKYLPIFLGTLVIIYLGTILKELFQEDKKKIDALKKHEAFLKGKPHP